jgi:arginine N-succinyltransferase
MSDFLVRTACLDDLDALLALAKQTGGGFTNLPPDRDDLEKRILLSEAALRADISEPGGELYLLVCLDTNSGTIIGTASIFSKLGTEWPFYSYRIINISQTSRELHKVLQSDVLHLVNDYDGYSEVGGLFLNADYRGIEAGRLLARSRYLFIAQARKRFAKRICADLRGYADEHGKRPFWDGLGRHFFNMEFEAADHYNGLQGNQFIADLMPKYPIYVRLLPESAQAAIGRPHNDGRGALKLLYNEGFQYENCIDIFDGGPSVVADIDALAAIKNSVETTAQHGPGQRVALVCSGTAHQFRATVAPVSTAEHTGHLICSDIILARLMVSAGDKVRYVYV